MECQSPNSKRCGGGKSAADVITEPHGCRADFPGEYFTRYGGIAREKSRSKKSHKRPEQQQPKSALRQTINRRQRGGNQQINEIRFTPPKCIGEKAKQRVTQPFPQAQNQEKCSRLDQAQPSSALRNGQ